jgi:amino acid adenylation domain-containing protein
MNVYELFELLNKENIKIRLDKTMELKVAFPSKEIDPKIIALIKNLKPEIIQKLSSGIKQQKKITKTEKSEVYRLSFAQQRLWFIDKLQGSSAEYNIPQVLILDGEFIVDAAELAILTIINRHEILRTIYIDTNEGAVQKINKEIQFSLTKHDLTHLSENERNDKLNFLIDEDALAPFNLNKDLMIRASYVLLEKASVEDNHEQTGALLFNMHHIASDAWSLEVLTKEFITLYQIFLAGKTDPLPPLDIQYSDYANHQREWLQGEVLDSQLNYWESQLADLPATHNLLLDYPRPEKKQYVGEMVSEFLPAEVALSLNKLAKCYQLTPFMLLHSILALVLSSHSNSTDIVLATPVANRQQAELEPLIGFFVNTLVLRLDTSYVYLNEYLAHVRQVHLDAQSNQDVPFEKLVERLNLPRSESYTSLFQIMLSTNSDFSFPESDEPDLSEDDFSSDIVLTPLSSDIVPAKFDLSININIDQQGVLTNWTYDAALFSNAHIKDINAHLCQLLTSFAKLDEAALTANPLVKDLAMLSADEINYLLNNPNNTATEQPIDKCIHELFEAQVHDTPNNTALIFENKQMSYSLLNRKANQVARYLIEKHHICPGTLVGICVERSFDMMIGILAILKAGGAYVPLDPDYPQARLAYMLNDAELAVVLTQTSILVNTQLLDSKQCAVIALELDVFDEYPDNDLDKNCFGLTGIHPAYLIYTSGSTGQPKGVLSTHQGAVNLALNQQKLFDITEKSKVLQFASVSFDAAVWDWIMALTNAASLVICSQEQRQSVIELQAVLLDEKITHALLPPALLATLEYSEGYYFKYLIVGGDTCDIKTARLWGKEYNLINAYGPSEASVVATCTQFNLDKVSSIGKPLDNVSTYIFDSKCHLTPLGVPGELHVGGAGLANGYLNREELTAERFIENPYYDKHNQGSSQRLYKTGDLVRYLEDGSLEFIGRVDDQVKVRGFRIEPGEIAYQLELQISVDSALVLVKENHDEGEINKQLVAYVKISAESLTHELTDQNLVKEIKQGIQQVLPEHMIPNVFILIDEWPLTTNGKIDQKALPAFDGIVSQDEYVGAQTITEKALVEIWANLLKLDVDKISTTANFFELGGHSLLSVRLVSEIRKTLSIELAVRAVFSSATLKELAEEVDATSGTKLRQLVKPFKRNDNTELLSFAQQRLWFIDQFQGSSAEYNMPLAFYLDGRFELAAAELAIITIIKRHEILRTVYVETDNGAVQYIKDTSDFTLRQYDFTDLSEHEKEEQLHQLMDIDTETPFNLSQDLMVRASFVILNQGNAEEGEDQLGALLFNMHHIASDGWSIEILTREFVTLYQAFVEKKDDPLPPLAIQYADYARSQREWLKGEVLAEQLNYWLPQLSEVPAVHSLLLDKVRPAEKQHVGAMVSKELSAEVASGLHALAKRYQLTPFMLLHSSLALILSHHSNSHDIVIGTPVANRMQAEIESLIGFFINTLVLRLDTSYEYLEDYFSHVRQVHLDAQTHQDVPFELLVEHLDIPRSTAHTPLFQIMMKTNTDFSLADDAVAEENFSSDIDLSPLSSDKISTKFDINININIDESGVFTNWIYDTSLFTESHVTQFNDHLCQLLTGLAALKDNSTVANPLVKDLPILSLSELEHLTKTVNETEKDYPKDQCIHQTFELQAQTNPDKIALIFENKKLSFIELNQRANQVAHYLKEHYLITPDTLVGLCAERSMEMVIGMLGILKAGGAYVPLDPSYPQSRLKYICDDADLTVILCQKAVQASMRTGEHRTLCLDTNVFEKYPTNDLELSEITSSHLAYVIYTSGSTGQPKGVLTEHRNVVSFQSAFKEQLSYLNITECSPWLWANSFAFDASTKGMLALCHGRTVVLAGSSDNNDPKKIANLIKIFNIEVYNTTPNMLTYIVTALEEERLASVNLISSGEQLSASDCKYILAYVQKGGVKLLNAYGPTEATINSTYGEVKEEINIGRPVSNTQVYIMDSRQVLVPHGAIGELYIGGAGLARGYLNNSALTAERFIDNPFYDAIDPNSSPRLYKTGDFVHYNTDLQGQPSCLIYIGRTDDQVKIRGFRIELGEVQHQLSLCAGVVNAQVMAKEDYTGSKNLVAYIKSKPEETDLIANIKLSLTKVLPSYMVPSTYVLIETWPLMVNGKVDKQALHKYDGTILQGEYIAPETETEITLVKIWAKLLKLNVDKISTADNFFDLGGHSLLTIRLISEIRNQLQTELPVKTIFDFTTVAELSMCIDNETKTMLRQLVKAVTHENNLERLSFSQQRLWFIDQLQGGSADYNMPAAFLVEHDFKLNVAEQAIRRIISRHQVLRTVFYESEVGVMQKIQETFDFSIEQHDLTSFNDIEKQKQLKCLIEDDAKQSFDLSLDLMVRASFVLLENVDNTECQHGALLFNLHHIASDGWSMELLKSEFFVQYQALLEGKPDPLKPLTIQYADYAYWQRNWLQKEMLDIQLDYWDQHLADVPAVHSLVLDNPRPDVKRQEGAQVSGFLSADVALSLNRLSKRHQLTGFMLLHAALALVISRHSNSTDIVIGTPFANRLQAELEPLIGFFVNTLVLRVDTSNTQLDDYFAHVRQVHLDAQTYQDVPFEQLVERLKIPRTTAHTPLFQIILTTKTDFSLDTQVPNNESTSLELTSLASENIPAKFDLTIDLRMSSEGVFLNWIYDKSIFNEERIEQFNDHLCRVLKGLAELEPNNVDKYSIKSLPMLSSSELTYLTSTLNDTQSDFPIDECIHQLFEAQAYANPDKTALIFEGNELTYQQLNQRANQVAHFLIEHHQIKPDTLVGICVERSLEMVVGVLGILKAGGAYVPLDPQFPKQRLNFMLEDADLSIVLTQDFVLANINFGERSTVCLNSDKFDRYPVVNLTTASINLTSSHLAYVIYTSGSTGQPKGVCQHHKTITNLVYSNDLNDGINQPLNTLQYTALTFDVSIQEFATSWFTGSSLVIVNQSEKDNLNDLHKLLSERAIGRIFMPPVVFEYLVGQLQSKHTVLPDLKEIFVAGDALYLPTEFAAFTHTHPQCKIYNHYGPTETHALTTRLVTDNERRIVPIGKVLRNTSLYLLNSNHLLVPFGTIGELYACGIGMARCYLNNEALTAERFIENPYYNVTMPNNNQRLYKTGDLVRYLPDNNLEFIGRVDDQVKIRGFRIELGEIDHQLSLFSGIDSATVLAKDYDLGKQLIAYIKPDISDLSEEDKSELVKNAGEAIAQVLPSHMVPKVIVVVESWPLTANGKLDKKRLPEPDIDLLHGEYIAPATEIEKILAEIWSKLLYLHVDKISITMNFFELGGHSLLLVNLVQQINQVFETKVEISISQLFPYQSISEQAQLLQQGIGERKKIAIIENLGKQYELLPNVYCVPGIAGLAHMFTDFVKYAGGKFNVKAFNHQGLMDDKTPFDSIDENAVCFVKEILNVQKTGQYIIVGHSYGGVVALEIVKLLREMGYKAKLILLDSYFEQHTLKVDNNAESKRDNVTKLEDAVSSLADKDQILEDNVTQLLEKQSELFRYYIPTNTGMIKPVILFASEAYFDVEQYTERLKMTFTQGITCHYAPGDHFTILKQNGAKKICEIIVQEIA